MDATDQWRDGGGAPAWQQRRRWLWRQRSPVAGALAVDVSRGGGVGVDVSRGSGVRGGDLASQRRSRWRLAWQRLAVEVWPGVHGGLSRGADGGTRAKRRRRSGSGGRKWCGSSVEKKEKQRAVFEREGVSVLFDTEKNIHDG